MKQMKSPFKDVLHVSEDVGLPELIEHVRKCPAGYVPTVLAAYSVPKSKLHVTLFFDVVDPSRLLFDWHLAGYLLSLIGQSVQVEVLESEPPFKSVQWPDAVLKEVRFPDHDKVAEIILRKVGYPWQPHITFHDGKVVSIPDLVFTFSVGYMLMSVPEEGYVPPAMREGWVVGSTIDISKFTPADELGDELEMVPGLDRPFSRTSSDRTPL